MRARRSNSKNSGQARWPPNSKMCISLEWDASSDETVFPTHQYLQLIDMIKNDSERPRTSRFATCRGRRVRVYERRQIRSTPFLVTREANVAKPNKRILNKLLQCRRGSQIEWLWPQQYRPREFHGWRRGDLGFSNFAANKKREFRRHRRRRY
jgi:hypothetical protein